MRTTVFTLLSLISVGGLFVFAHAKNPSDSASTTYDLLTIGKSHVIHFRETPEEFRSESVGFRVEQSGERTPTPVATTLEVFTAIDKSGDSWVLLEHPKSPDDFGAWDYAKRMESALKNPDSKKILSAQLLKQAAAGQLDELKRIETTQTWVNMYHAVTVKALDRETWLLQMIADSNQD